MVNHNEFVNFLHDLLKPLGSIEAKSMFGRFGIYRRDLMFGFVNTARNSENGLQVRRVR
jgi:TfoX/Sxy family transcriptional regulator of competence genes